MEVRRTLIAGIVLLAAAALAASATAQDYPRYRALGSTYVPLDSWVYPAFERLAAMGYVPTAMTGMKPWTRTECARLVEEAGEHLRLAVVEDRGPSEQAARLHAALEREFGFELEALGGGGTRSAQVESVYARATSISGAPLTDAFHFGQTISYDFGRPFRRGTNALAGTAARATAGPLAVYVRGEYQHAPAAPALPTAALDMIAERDRIPRPAGRPFAEFNRGALLDAYVALNVRNWQLSAGKHSFSWGTGPEGALLLSHNAAPMYMLRLGRTTPFVLPGVLRRMGPVRTEIFLARLEGHRVFPRPWMFGQKLSFKPKPWLEASFARTITIGGVGGDPFTFSNFWKAYFAQDRNLAPGDNTNPGDERNSTEWILYLPWMGNRVALYTEAFADDKWSYMHPTRAAWRPGLYIARLPGLEQMDFRIEAADSEALGLFENFNTPGSIYWNFEYKDGHTNKGVLMGNTVGRMGRAVHARTNYWFSPRHRLEFQFKHNTVRPEFAPGGASWQDYTVRHEVHLRSGVYLKSLLQFEHIRRFPVLFDGSRRNVTASIEIGFLPEWMLR